MEHRPAIGLDSYDWFFPSQDTMPKGGFALQLRLGASACTIKEIDLLVLGEVQEILPRLREAGTINLGGWYVFEVMDTTHSGTQEIGGQRYP